MFESIIAEVNNFNKVIIFPHTNMDGDSVGSAKALALALKQIGKDVIILADEAVPEYVGFLNCNLFVTEIPAGFSNALAFAVDCSDISRIENRIDAWNLCTKRVCIDHHPGEDKFADVIVRSTEASAAALLVFDFLLELKAPIDKEIAEAIYTGILTDTGAFKYANADAATHLAVAKLYEYGINHVAICNAVYENKPYRQAKIEAHALKKAQFVANNRGIVSYVSRHYYKSIDAPYSYTENAIDVLRSIRGVEVAAILKEKERGVFKVSFRSKNGQDVSAIARKYGGGGHKPAAACTLEMPLEEAIELIKKEIIAILQ